VPAISFCMSVILCIPFHFKWFFCQLYLQQASSVSGEKGDGKHWKKASNVVCTISCWISFLYFTRYEMF
jgi:phosphoglucomutase